MKFKLSIIGSIVIAALLLTGCDKASEEQAPKQSTAERDINSTVRLIFFPSGSVT